MTGSVCLRSDFAGSSASYLARGAIGETSSKYQKRKPGTAIGVKQFSLTKVSLAEMDLHVVNFVDATVTIAVVESGAMSAAQNASIKPFLAGATAMAAGAILAFAAPSLSSPWLTNVGLILLAVGALIAAGASEQYRRG